VLNSRSHHPFSRWTGGPIDGAVVIESHWVVGRACAFLYLSYESNRHAQALHSAPNLLWVELWYCASGEKRSHRSLLHNLQDRQRAQTLACISKRFSPCFSRFCLPLVVPLVPWDSASTLFFFLAGNASSSSRCNRVATFRFPRWTVDMLKGSSGVRDTSVVMERSWCSFNKFEWRVTRREVVGDASAGSWTRFGRRPIESHGVLRIETVIGVVVILSGRR